MIGGIEIGDTYRKTVLREEREINQESNDVLCQQLTSMIHKSFLSGDFLFLLDFLIQTINV
ncbi:hypothetical protein, partial [Mesotoga sp.]|uniref:hypothetical protein n=1 Tax=Mesotoga sp. TaxID=2053577 RepID=UPI0035694245